MKSLGSTRSLLSTLVLVFLSFICVGKSVKQELWFYDAEDNSHLFHSHVSDTAYLSSFLPRVTRACARGVWDLYSAVNFLTFSSYQGSYSRSRILCRSFTTAASVKSLRHLGANDTDTDALSLYESDYASGKEIFVTAPVHTGIKNKITSIAITGASDWMLFEGMNLDGKSICLKLPSGYYIYYIHVSLLNVTTIGSVFKGCDAQEIQNYNTLQGS